jgi:hypothetical protein
MASFVAFKALSILTGKQSKHIVLHIEHIIIAFQKQYAFAKHNGN